MAMVRGGVGSNQGDGLEGRSAGLSRGQHDDLPT
jgi:hypothetical protein